MRRNLKTGKLYTLFTTKKFKIALKNKVYNFFMDSVQNLADQDLALYYEDDPFFAKINLKKMSIAHQKGISKLPFIDTVILYEFVELNVS